MYRVISQRRLGLGLGLGLSIAFCFCDLEACGRRYTHWHHDTGYAPASIYACLHLCLSLPIVPPSHRPRELIADRLGPQARAVRRQVSIFGTQTLRVTYRIRPGPVPLTGNPNASPPPSPAGYVATTYCIIQYSSPSHERTSSSGPKKNKNQMRVVCTSYIICL